MLSRTPAGRKNKAIGIRFRSQAELDRIRRAAKREGMTFNTFVAGSAAVAAEQVLRKAQEIQPQGQAS